MRRLAEGLSEEDRCVLYANLSRSHPDYRPCDFSLGHTRVTVTQDSETLVFPRPLPLVKHLLCASGYLRWLHRKYTLPGFVEITPGDRVLDCGAYVGGFAAAALQAGAGCVDCIEPAPDTSQALVQNLASWPNARCHQMGLYSADGEKELNLSASAVEHSFLTPDVGATGNSVQVRIARLDTLARELRTAFDFVKIEAEGVEAEIVTGLGALRPSKIAIDVSPERDGKSPFAVISRHLAGLGYETRLRGAVLFARRQDTARHPSPPRSRRIFAMWEGEPSPLVEICLARWRALNPDYTLLSIGKKSRRRIVAALGRDPDRLSIQAQSDIVRHWYLTREGGVWIDATLFPLAPLDSFLDAMSDASGFAAFGRSQKPARPIATWLIAGSPASRLTTGWWREIRNYWRIERTPILGTRWHTLYTRNHRWIVEPTGGAALPVFPYLWSHHLFDRLLGSRPELRAEWQQVARPDGESALAWMSILKDTEASPAEKQARLSKTLTQAPVQKLDHRTEVDPSTLSWLGSLPL
ncbi:FkbM family methyltransferase [Palleronia caenipelagi]|uniref:FkbM family methyltransferase n=1 Tax=Palleronia caenipelagi TaxID=2489174 RepID=A0A547PHR5_9RHOB|nr:FkbM family methyltransferase [Palleronia caenipelagi]